MRRISPVIIPLVVVAFVIGLTVLLSYHSASTAADQVGLHFKGGPFSSKVYDSYIPPSTKKWFGPGDKEYLYPNNVRTFDATGGKDAEMPPITSVSKNQAEISTPVSVTFALVTDEKTLLDFHNKIGNRYQAYMEDDKTSDGWRKMLDFYVGQALNTSLDRMVQGYDWQQLYSDPSIRTALQTQVDKELPDLLKQQMGGDYFTNFQVLVQQPTPTNQALKDTLAQNQANLAAAQTAKAKAEADLATARAQTALANAQAAQKQAEINGFGGFENYNKAQAVEKGLNPYQPTYIVSGTK